MPGVEAALGLPVFFILTVRFIMSVVLQSEKNQNADSLLSGLIQGILSYHAFLSANQAITAALFLGIGGRMLGDFVSSQDTWKLASTLLGIAFGVLMADVVSYLFDDKDWSTFTVFNMPSRKSGRTHRSTKSHRRVSEPRRVEEMPGVSAEASSLESHSHVGDEVLSDVEKEVARLRAKALHAAGQRRRFREERKWALSQGNLARAFQLRWQVKKHHALANSFTREADEKLVEADRTKRGPLPQMSLPSQQSPSQPQTPFVQVVVEGGRDFSESSREERGTAEHLQKTVRAGKGKEPLRSDVSVNSRGVLRKNSHERNGDTSPQTSDTWSRQLD